MAGLPFSPSDSRSYPSRVFAVALADAQNSTLVSSKNSRTALIELSFHNHLTDGALGCLQPQSLPILLHNPPIWGAQARTQSHNPNKHFPGLWPLSLGFLSLVPTPGCGCGV